MGKKYFKNITPEKSFKYSKNCNLRLKQIKIKKGGLNV